MNIEKIPVITVSYNTPELVKNLLTTFREKYSNPYYIIDGSDPEHLAEIKNIVSKFNNVHLIDFGYNIHHGPGMAWAIENLSLSGPVLFLDSDIEIVRSGFIEELFKSLKPNMYGVGAVGYVNRGGFNIDYAKDAIRYLHPICMLCNIEVMRQWPLPTKHGAPMTEAMLALHDSQNFGLIENIEWVMNDAASGTQKIFIDHKGQGTVFKTGGYHLEEWMQKAQEEANQQEALVDLEDYDKNLLAYIPTQCKNLVEIGCKSGAMAAAYKKINPNCKYQGIEPSAMAAQAARKYCDTVLQVEIESVGIEFFTKLSTADCWILGNVLEKLKDPWTFLARIFHTMPKDGVIVASIANAQHWSVQAKLGIGDFRYQETGSMNRAHLRWFTRATLFELFMQNGFRIVEGHPIILDEPFRDKVIPAIRLMAESVGANPDVAVEDSLPIQYIIKAAPAEKS
ncbi:MAG: methyltransferase domain-containing protein [Burkholderiaceae bacterium]|nr:methyltransferase domain-containing protein [Burkholderiaceae bacterium]